MHPFDAFDDPDLLAAARIEVAKLKRIAGLELGRKYGKFSKQDAAREAFLKENLDTEGDNEAPPGRDWEKEIKIGIHACPSMNHLHIHVISVDSYSGCMKHKKHYNSFNTSFFVELDAFPLPVDDERRNQSKWPDRDLVCWRCKKNFTNKFKMLKEHLVGEFNDWREE